MQFSIGISGTSFPAFGCEFFLNGLIWGRDYQTVEALGGNEDTEDVKLVTFVRRQARFLGGGLPPRPSSQGPWQR